MLISFAISSNGNDIHLARLRRSIRMQTRFDTVEVLIGRPARHWTLSAVRNDLYARAQGRWVYFLDEDTELPDDRFVERVLRILKDMPREAAIGGGYLDGSAGGWQRAYNALVNYWLSLHARQLRDIPVAGNFVVPSSAGLATGDFPFSMSHSFGGEEVGLKENLERRGLSFRFDPRFSVLHHGGKTWRGFLQRAWQHGRAPRQKVAATAALAHYSRWVWREAGWRVGARMALYLSVVWLARLV